MAPTSVYEKPRDATCITNTTSTVNRSDDYYHSVMITINVRQQKKKSKKELIQERAELLRRQSLMLFSEVKPKIFKAAGYPYRNIPKVHHQNYRRH